MVAYYQVARTKSRMTANSITCQRELNHVKGANCLTWKKSGRSTALLCIRHLPGWSKYEALAALGQGGCAFRPQLTGDLEPPCDLPAEVPLPEILRISELRYQALGAE